MNLKNVQTKERIAEIQNLYEAAFPANERKPFALIQEKVKSGQMEILAFEEEENFIGMAMVMMDEDFILIDYFAMKKEKRGEGYGSRAICMLRNYYAKKRIFLEIAIVPEKVETREDELKERRKKFYLSNGLKETKVYVKLFGVEMELLTFSKQISYEDYIGIYLHIFGERSRKYIQQVEKYDKIGKKDVEV